MVVLDLRYFIINKIINIDYFVLFKKPNRYHPTRVLEGNWFEDRRRFIKTLYNYNTTYNIFHAPKPYSAPDSSVVWDAIFQGEVSI